MRNLLFLGVPLLPTALLPQAVPPGAPDQIRAELIEIEHKIGQANLDCDYKYFEQIEADDFLFTDASGDTTTKKEDLAGEKNCHKSAGTYDLDQSEVRVYGNTAVVTARVTIDGTTAKGSPCIASAASQMSSPGATAGGRLSRDIRPEFRRHRIEAAFGCVSPSPQ